MNSFLEKNSVRGVLVGVSISLLLAFSLSSHGEDLGTTNPSPSASSTPFPSPTPSANNQPLPVWFDLTKDTTTVEATEGFRLGSDLVPAESGDSANGDFRFNMKDWNKMRDDIESGRQPGEAVVETVEKSTVTAEVNPPKPPPGKIAVELPYESSLSVTGRKVIKVELKNTHISGDRASELGGKQDTQSFTMEQELQARIQGTVARKTTINVNYDDTKENVRDFSVIYQGDPDEVVQEAAFGDITLSLPSTEFVNYNKQLFGIRASLKYKNAGLMMIGSRTKGTTETKRFVGSTTRNQIFVNDTDYLRRRYYDLTFGSAAVVAGSVSQLNPISLPINTAQPEIIYIEDTTGINPNATDVLVTSPTVPTASFAVRMRQMSRGVDYSIDALNGIITFNTEVPESARVAVDFTDGQNRRLTTQLTSAPDDVAVIIKDKTPEAPNVSQEIKRFYSAKSRNIAKDNGLGNFVFKVMDKNRTNEIGTNLNPIQRYPDSIEMDFVNGIFKLKNLLSDPVIDFSAVYAPNVSASAAQQAVFSIEYQSILRTFTLRPNIVLQSESVIVDGRKVNRDLDYFIDYDIGLITFFNEDLIRESTVIEITYEFAPFGSALGETLVGARGTYDILQNKKIAGVGMEKWQAGSTVLYNFGTKPTAPPDIRSLPSSLLVTEGDTQIKSLTFGSLPIKTDVSVEQAASAQNPNLFGKALVDSFEGLKQEDASAMLKDSWQVAANTQYDPDARGYNLISDFRARDNSASHLQWNEVDVATLDPNDEGATQRALQVSYNLNPTGNPNTIPEQVAMTNIISLVGRDFSKKSTLEIELEGAGPVNGADVDVIVEYGTFNEDADGDGDLDTEDKLPFDGILNLGEDIGWVFNGPGNDLVSGNGDDTTIGIGGGNARLDSEDLNNDKVLNKTDTPATDIPLFVLSSSHTSVNDGQTNVHDLSFTGRKLFQVPLNILSKTVDEQNRLTSVRQVRVTIRNKSGPSTPKSGTFVLAKLSVVGISWEPAVLAGSNGPSSQMTVRAINNKDDVNYISIIGNPAYNDLYKDSAPENNETKEQALAINYNLLNLSSGTSLNKFSTPRDFSKHDYFKFFIRRADPGGSNTNGTFYLQAGSEAQYQQVAINVAAIPNNQWMLVSLRQADTNGDGIPETWVSEDPNVTVSLYGGIPSLTQVAQMKLGVINESGSAALNEIWINEIHESQPHERDGSAKKYAFDSTWSGWMDFGGSVRDVDRNWQTPTTQITNQDRRQESAYFNFNRLSVMPITYKTSRDITVTPSAFRSNNNALVSVLEEGRVETTQQSATMNLLIPKFPQFNFSYNQNKSENNTTERTESNEEFRAGATYSNPFKVDLLPGRKLTFQPLPSAITLSYTNKQTRLRFPDANELIGSGVSTTPFTSTNLNQVSNQGEARMAFGFWDGFTFNPTYSLKIDKERRTFRDDEFGFVDSNGAIASKLAALDNKETPRALTQSIAASGNLRLLKWLDPRYNYSFSGTENNGLPTLTNTTGYFVKTIDRNSQGEVSAAIQVAQIRPASKLFNSMNINGSYKLESGDSYADIPDGFRWRSKLWVGDALAVSSGTTGLARRTAATDRRTFRTNLSWLPFSGFVMESARMKPLSTLSFTNNYLSSTEDSETTGSTKRVESKTFPDLIVTINNFEELFNVKRGVTDSRLVLKDNRRKTDTINISKSLSDAYGADYQFRLMKKWDVSTTYNVTRTREDNLVSNLLSSKSDTVVYSIQTRIPKGNWAYTPRYQHSSTDARNAVQLTNDLRNDTYAVQIYGDINRPIGIRFGRHELGLANRLIVNSTVQWDKKRSSINPSTNYLDTYSATLSGDYTLSQNFRMAIGGNFAQEVHHPDFSKLDQSTFGLNTTLTIQF